MNNTIKQIIKHLSFKTLSLRKKGILIGKPWTLIDNDNEIQKLIFRKDNSLILSKNGVVSDGSWEYFAEAKSLLIDRINDKILLKEQYIDDNVLILKKDGTDNDFFALANENTLPDLNIPKYLNSLKIKEFRINERKLINGKILQIYNANDLKNIYEYKEHLAEIINDNYEITELENGSYLTKDKKYTIFIKDSKVESIKENLIKQIDNNTHFEIIDGIRYYIKGNKGKRVTINGKSIPDQKILDSDNVVYEIKESIITSLSFVFEYELENEYIIRIEQKDENRISKGDVIIESSPITPIPNGVYRIKKKWLKIKIENSIIV